MDFESAIVLGAIGFASFVVGTYLDDVLLRFKWWR